jgi:hypothetical protein
MIVHLEVSDEDVEFILAHCDEGESGGITKARVCAWRTARAPQRRFSIASVALNRVNATRTARDRAQHRPLASKGPPRPIQITTTLPSR